MHRLILLGLNHTTAPLELREKLAFSAKQHRTALLSFKERFAGCEALLLSTCNRVEFYAAANHAPAPDSTAIRQFLAELRGIDPAMLDRHVYSLRSQEAVEHLFSVAASLDSMVLGETQILSQVRNSYELAKEAQTVGGILNPLMQRAIAAGKQVMTTTPLGEGRLSLAGIAVDYARKIFERFDDKTVLTIGAGEMAELVLTHFSELKPGKLIVCNRDPEKARALIAPFGGEAVAFDRLDDALALADIVISSTGAPHVIISRDRMAAALKKRRYRSVFMIDLAVPRDIEASVGNLEHIYLYNIDDLQQVVAATQAHRTEAVDQARAIVSDHVAQFVAWNRQRELGPSIERLYERYHELARQELDRTLHKLPELSASDRAHLEDLTRRIVNKLLHDPLRALRHGDDSHASASVYLHALEKMFGLDQPQPQNRDDETPDR